MVFKFRLVVATGMGTPPTQPSIGGVTIGSTLPSHGHEGYGGYEKFWWGSQ